MCNCSQATVDTCVKTYKIDMISHEGVISKARSSNHGGKLYRCTSKSTIKTIVQVTNVIAL